MSPRVTITLAIIVAISVGIGAAAFGILIMVFGGAKETECTIIASGITLFTAGVGSLIARTLGGLRELEDRDDEAR